MSGFSFSHKFSQSWLNVPKAIRQAITQELIDIADLLESDTNPHDFRFYHQNLNAYLDRCLLEHQALKALHQTTTTVTNPQNKTHNTQTTPEQISPDYQAVIQNLQTHLDDYLTQHLTQMSDELKEWLRNEIQQHLFKNTQAQHKKET